jgi:hypothetical protein
VLEVVLVLLHRLAGQEELAELLGPLDWHYFLHPQQFEAVEYLPQVSYK